MVIIIQTRFLYGSIWVFYEESCPTFSLTVNAILQVPHMPASLGNPALSMILLCVYCNTGFVCVLIPLQFWE